MVSVATWALPAVGKLPQPVTGSLCIQDTRACPARWQRPFSSNKPGAAPVCSLATAGLSSGRHNIAYAACSPQLEGKTKQFPPCLFCSLWGMICGSQTSCTAQLLWRETPRTACPVVIMQLIYWGGEDQKARGEETQQKMISTVGF